MVIRPYTQKNRHLKFFIFAERTLNDSIVIIDDLGKRSQAVGGTGGVGDHREALVVFVVVYSHNKHWGVGGGGGDDDLLSAALSVGQGLVLGGEHAGRLHDVLSAGAGPVDRGRVTLVEDGDLHSVDVEELAVLLDLALELSVGGVILEHVDHVVQGDEGVIDGDNLNKILA